MSETVKIVHQDGTVVDAEQYGNGRWVIRNTWVDYLYRAENGWREVKPEPKDVTGECRISKNVRVLSVPCDVPVQYPWNPELPPGHFWKKDVGCIQENGKTFATTVLRIMKEGS